MAWVDPFAATVWSERDVAPLAKVTPGRGGWNQCPRPRIQSKHHPPDSTPKGRLISWTKAEHAQYVEAVREGLARLRLIPDDPSEDDREFCRVIDSHRPKRPLFEEYD